ncbi:phosphate ABC transporter permease PstA [Xylanimonas sp. McL0601]|uniref:phosphate ABC transporter permease PstA n=1 Tax=Xylanimonas sp. McL0601 TaxID=3414739 RepID=UPI003CE960E0
MSAVTSDATATAQALLTAGDKGRKRKDRLMTGLVWFAFLLAIAPLVSLLWTVVTQGIGRLNADFLFYSMRNVYGGMDAGGAYHAILGTLLITLWTALISVPLGLLVAIYLVEYGRGALARSVTFFVDVMTGIPSIVAGLFAYAVFVVFFGAGIRMGIMGSVALSLLMTPVVVRSCEEMLRLVPNELREASLALGVPKWLTIVKVVLRTSVAGLTTGVLLAIARVIGETAPLLIAVGVTASINTNMFSGSMMTLPVFIYDQYKAGPVPCSAAVTDCIASINFDRAWTAALTLVIIVVILNLLGRLVTRLFAPKLR